MNKRLVVCAGLLAVAACARAVTDCRITSGGGMAFGNYDVLSPSPNDSVAQVVAVCTRNGGPQNVTVALQLSQGMHGTSVNARRMANGGAAGGYLAYALFRDVGRTANWGFSAGVDTVSQTLSIPNRNSRVATFTIYGRIPALQDVAVGSYSDRVTATVTP